MTKAIVNLLSGSSKVTVVGNEKLEGNPIITPSLDQNGNPKTDLNGNELGTMRLEQTSRSFTGTFVNSRRRVAFLTGTLTELNSIVKAYNLKEGSEVDGRIIQIESLAPMWKNQTPKMNPQTAEEVGVVVNGKLYPVYMQQRYSEDENAKDVLIRTAEDVNAWIGNQQALGTIVSTVDGAAVPQA